MQLNWPSVQLPLGAEEPESGVEAGVKAGVEEEPEPESGVGAKIPPAPGEVGVVEPAGDSTGVYVGDWAGVPAGDSAGVGDPAGLGLALGEGEEPPLLPPPPPPPPAIGV